MGAIRLLRGRPSPKRVGGLLTKYYILVVDVRAAGMHMLGSRPRTRKGLQQSGRVVYKII